MLLVLPSDHLIADGAGFRDAVRRALPLAEQGWIVTFGIKADRPETGFGWIEPGEELGEGMRATGRFVEKPDAAGAAALLGRGAMWNAGIFLLRADRFLAELELQAPEVAAAARAAVAGQALIGSVATPDAKPLESSPSISIDHAVMEKAEKIAVVPVDIGWSDIGGWLALREASELDADGNAMSGQVIAIDAANCLIRSEGPLVAAIGVEDLVIVACRDAVLVLRADQAQRVSEAVARLREKGREDLL